MADLVRDGQHIGWCLKVGVVVWNEGWEYFRVRIGEEGKERSMGGDGCRERSGRGGISPSFSFLEHSMGWFLPLFVSLL